MEKRVEVSTRTVKVDLARYSLVYDTEISGLSKEKIAAFAAKIFKKTGISPAIRESVAEGEPAIYIGLVDHPVAKRARRAVEGCGWIICESAGNLFITGTNQNFTNLALIYFAENYLKGKVEGTEIAMPKKVTSSGMDAIPLIENGVYRYAMVYSEELDDEEGWSHVIPGNHSGGAAKDSIDRPVRLCFEFADAIAAAAKREEKPLVTSDITVNENEVLVGITDRAESWNALNAIGADEYAVTLSENKIFLSAWNDEAIEYAANFLKAAIVDARSKTVKSRECLWIPADLSVKGKIVSNWVTDFAKPTGEGVDLVGTLSSGDDSLIYCYRGAGVNATAFDRYCQKLLLDGYETVQEHTIDENRFATYVNRKANVTLNVEYVNQKKEIPFSYFLSEQYIKRFAPTIRVTSAPLSSVVLPPAEFLDPNARFGIRKLTDTMITQVSFNYEVGDKGMCYIITLEDGTFVIADGSTNKNAMDEQIMKHLCNLYKKVHGHLPTPEQPIHIRAWTMSHEHSDHYSSFMAFVRKYGKDPLVKFDYFLANFTSKTQDYNAMQPSHAVADNMKDLQAHCPNFKYVKVHTGQKLYIGNIVFEILFTHQDMAPYRQPFYNDTSTVFKTTVYNTAAEDHKTIFMILGDASLLASTFMRGCFSNETLRAELVQIGHHGGFGCENELYDIMQPTSTWWTHFATFVHKMCAPENKHKITLEYPVGHHVMYELESHKYAFVSQGFSTTVTLKLEGTTYHDLYDATQDPDEATPVAYDNFYVIDVAEKRKG